MISRILAILFLTTTCIGAPSDIKEAGRLSQNSLRSSNPGFENGKSKWTSTGSAVFSITSTAADVAFGSRAGAWDASATGEFLRSELVSVPPGLYSRDCVIIALYKNGDALVKIEADDGTSTIAGSSTTLATASTYTLVKKNFTCPSSGNWRVEIESTGNAASVIFDHIYLGEDLSTEASATGSVFSAFINCDASPTISREKGNWLDSVTKNVQAGDCTLNFTAGVFTDIPNCACQGSVTGGDLDCAEDTGTARSTSLIRMQLTNLGGSVVDGDFDILCHGN